MSEWVGVPREEKSIRRQLDSARDSLTSARAPFLSLSELFPLSLSGSLARSAYLWIGRSLEPLHIQVRRDSEP